MVRTTWDLKFTAPTKRYFSAGLTLDSHIITYLLHRSLFSLHAGDERKLIKLKKLDKKQNIKYQMNNLLRLLIIHMI